jgi:type IV pilus assembly protein PilM
VGSYSVKLLLAHGGGRFGVVEQPLPPAPDDTPPAASVVAQVIGDALGRLGTTPRGLRGVTMGISGADVIVKQIQLPLLDDSEVGPALRFESRKHLPFDPQSMIIDFQIINRSPTQKRLDVLLAAVSREHAEKHCEPLKLLGLDADILDATPLALTNALTHGADLQREAFVLLDIGHRSSHLTLYHRGEPYFTRRLEFGGRTVTEAISSGTQVPFDEAEEWKLAAGSAMPGFVVDLNTREMQAVHACLRSTLADDLRRSFAFYRTLGQLPDPMKLWISGGTARLPGLASHLSELIGMPVLQFDPLEKMPSVAAGFGPGPHFAQAYGLALRTA